MKSRKHILEILESRIAPAAAAAATLLPSTEFNSAGEQNYVKATFGAPVEVHAGQVLTTGGFNSGSYLLYVEKGDALVFLTDLNNNREVDFNEITGIAVSDGLQLVSFVDIHGDIVTNLKSTVVSFPGSPSTTRFTLTDSDNNASDDDPRTGGDGRVLLNSTIEKIELRPLAPTDVGDLNGDGVVDQADALIHQAPTTCSIFGNIYAGGGFGTADGKGGLIVNATNAPNFGQPVLPFVGSILTGTAVSGHFFSFGASNGNSSGVTQLLNDDGTPRLDGSGNPIFEQDNSNVSGLIVTFTPPRGQNGGDINGLTVTGTAALNIDTIHAGDGGIGGRGGNVSNIILPYDDTGGYSIIAGNGGTGPTGGDGGSIQNFSDLGSLTGQILLQTGSGGTGITGVGGHGGDFSFGTFNARGGMSLVLGDGGDGFTRGGDGASLLSGTFTQAVGLVGETALNIVGSTHIPSGINYDANLVIGTHIAVNFDPNDDTAGDYVISTGGPTSQLLVEMGSGQVISLPGPRNATAVVVADLNGDGYPDIAAGSGDVGSQEGIEVFLSQHDANGHFLGFSAPIISVLPQINTGDPQTGNASGLFFESPQQINSITAGDFNGDGKVELAVVYSQYLVHTAVGNQVTGLSKIQQAMVILQPDVQYDYLHVDAQGKPTPFLTGQFYADFGTKGFNTSVQAVPPIPKMPIVQISLNGGVAGSVVAEASPVNTSDGHDVIFVGIIGAASPMNVVNTYNYTVQTGDAFNIPPPTIQGAYDLGKYDSNRLPAKGTTPNDTPTAFILQDFSVFDYNGDGTADIAAVNSGAFLVGVMGVGDGSGVQVSGNGADQAGNNFGVPSSGEGGLNLIKSGGFLRIKTGDFDNGAGIETLDNFDSSGIRMIHSVFVEGPQDDVQGIESATVDSPILFPFKSVAPSGHEAFDFHYLDTTDPSSYDPGATDPDPTKTDVLFAFEGAIGFGALSIGIQAGNGGDSLLGAGGLGGGVGSGKIKVASGTPVSTGSSFDTGPDTNITGQLNIIIQGQMNLFAGNGGDGFTTGGRGGALSGINLQASADLSQPLTALSMTAVAGNGGRGVSGAGGLGGNVSYNSFDTVGYFDPATGLLVGGVTEVEGGSGGDGTIGGGGGSVIGNGTVRYDAYGEIVEAFAGNGGLGSRVGGAGGAITDFHATLPQITATFDTGSIFYQAGNGGTAVSGLGGTGGSVLRDSPTSLGTISDTMTLLAGDGGNGVTGGGGGQVANFTVTTAAPSQPSQITVHGGLGGSGTAGNGGAGGSVNTINVPSKGTAGNFNSVIAGDGGDSAGATGGAGGNVASLTSSTTDNSFAVTAGAGGDGLYRGGAGGSVLKTLLNFGASTNKALVIAGAGGNAHAFVPNSEAGTAAAARAAVAAYGGRAGVGGVGGSINGFSQIGSNLSHADLIAGNGGNTVNYGTFFDHRTFVGNGGSVANIIVDGSIGNVGPTVPIKSYNDIQAGQTVADFVDEVLRNQSTALNDSLGNVGIIVGAAGSNQEVVLNPGTKPLVASQVTSRLAVNGSLNNVNANHLMSAVAGSVDFIAAIRVVTGLNIPIATLAKDVDKVPTSVQNSNPAVFKNYIDSTGAPSSSPEVGGALIDGIIAAQRFLNSDGTLARPVYPEAQLG